MQPPQRDRLAERAAAVVERAAPADEVARLAAILDRPLEPAIQTR